MRVLGLDLSSVASGWAVVDEGKVVAKGVITFDDKMSPGAVSWYLRHQIEGIIVVYRPDEVAVEDVFLKINYLTTKVLSRLAGVVQELWYGVYGKDVLFYYATTARATTGIKGTAQKEEVMKAVNEKFKFRSPITDNNVADAVVVAYCGWLKKAPEKLGAKGTFGEEKSDGIGLVKKRRR